VTILAQDRHLCRQDCQLALSLAAPLQSRYRRAHPTTPRAPPAPPPPCAFGAIVCARGGARAGGAGTRGAAVRAVHAAPYRRAAAALPAHKHSSTQANCSVRISARVTGLRRAAHAARVHVCDHACDPARVCCESHVVYVQVLRVRMRVRAVHGLHRACQHARTFRIFASLVPCGGRTWRHGGYSSGLGLGLGLGTLWNVGGGGYPARRPGLSCSCTCQALGTPSCATSTN